MIGMCCSVGWLANIPASAVEPDGHLSHCGCPSRLSRNPLDRPYRNHVETAL
jgi:hypothetical protein